MQDKICSRIFQILFNIESKCNNTSLLTLFTCSITYHYAAPPCCHPRILVIPAQAGIYPEWIPACAGMTKCGNNKLIVLFEAGGFDLERTTLFIGKEGNRILIRWIKL